MGSSSGCAPARAGLVSACLQSHFRESDIACRYGGEEFLVVLPSCGKRDAGVQAEKLRGDISGSPLGITVSIGIATLPEDGHNWEMVLRRADDALYEAKSGGRDRVQLAQSPANAAVSTDGHMATSYPCDTGDEPALSPSQ